MEHILNIYKNHPLLLMLGVIILVIIVFIFIIIIIVVIEHYITKRQLSTQEHQLKMLESPNINNEVHDSIKKDTEQLIIEDSKNKLKKSFKSTNSVKKITDTFSRLRGCS